MTNKTLSENSKIIEEWSKQEITVTLTKKTAKWLFKNVSAYDPDEETIQVQVRRLFKSPKNFKNWNLVDDDFKRLMKDIDTTKYPDDITAVFRVEALVEIVEEFKAAHYPKLVRVAGNQWELDDKKGYRKIIAKHAEDLLKNILETISKGNETEYNIKKKKEEKSLASAKRMLKDFEAYEPAK